MADLARDVRQEFWRPPQEQPTTHVVLPDACRRCGTEFMVGAAFCHICGMGRHRSGITKAHVLTEPLTFLKTLDVTKIKAFFGLPLASLCAFLIGSLFVLIALAQGFRSGQEFSDFEAIQLLRVQWLVAACAAFLAAILLKNAKSTN